jgi:hypothetical protein
MGTNTNLYGNFNFNLLKLKPNTMYQFRAVVKNNAGSPDETIRPATNILSFTTSPNTVSLGGVVGTTSGCTGTDCTKITTCTPPYVLDPSTNFVLIQHLISARHIQQILMYMGTLRKQCNKLSSLYYKW